MAHSRQIARLIGPTLITLGVTEEINFDIFKDIPATVVYLNGGLLFIAGLAIIQVHNTWAKHWSTLVTLTGWMLFLAGAYRMFAPTAPQASKGIASDLMFAILVVAGAFLTFKGCASEQSR